MTRFITVATALLTMATVVLIPLRAAGVFETSMGPVANVYGIKSGLQDPTTRITWYQDFGHVGGRRAFDLNQDGVRNDPPVYFSVTRISGTSQYRAVWGRKPAGNCTGFQLLIYSVGSDGKPEGKPWASIEYVHVDSADGLQAFDLALTGDTFKQVSTVLAWDSGPFELCDVAPPGGSGYTGPHLHQQLMVSERGGAVTNREIRHVPAEKPKPPSGKEDSCDYYLPIDPSVLILAELTFQEGASNTGGSDTFPDRNLNVTVQGSGTVIRSAAPKPSGKYADCTEVMLTADESPGSGHEFVRWEGRGLTDGTDPKMHTVWMSRDQEITAVFALPVTLTTKTKVAGAAEFGGGGGIAPAVGTHAQWQGEEVTVEALATTGYTFSYWEVDGQRGGCERTSFTETGVGTVANCTVEMSNDRVVVAVFGAPFGLTVHTSVTGGTAICVLADTTESCPGTVTGGTRITVSADEAEGYVFDQWTVTTDGGAGARVAGEQTYTTTSLTIPVNANTTITPVFAPDTAPGFAVGTGTATFAVNVEGSVQLPRATGGNGDLSYSLSSIPAGLEFDSATVVVARTATTTGTMAAGTTVATLTVHDEDDNRATSDADTVTVTIRVSARTQPTATLVLRPTSIAENGGSTRVSATLSDPAPIGGASLTVNASGGSGYSLSPNRTLTFAAGAGFSTGTVTITAEHDADTENETVTVSATVASGGITAPADVTLTIRDDDAPPPPPDTYSWSATCPDGTTGSGTEATQAAADAAKAAWIAANCTVPPPPVFPWTATCADGTTGSGTEATQAAADAAKAAWIAANCTVPPPEFPWSATCPDGTTGSGTEDTQAKADAARAAWIAANCTVPPPPVFPWTATCPDGTTGSGTEDTQAKADAAEAAWIAANCTVPPPVFPWSATCPDGTTRSGTEATQAAADAAKAAWIAANCTVPPPEFPWSATCPDGTTGSGTEDTQAKADAARAAFLADCPTYSWSGVCYDAQGTTGGGSGLSQDAANAAGQTFEAACPRGGVTTSVLGTVWWYASVMCNNGTSFTLGPFTSSSAADTAGGLGVSTCGFGRLRLDLPSNVPLTLAQVRDAFRAALSALPTPINLDDLTLPEVPQRQDATPAPKAGGFSTYVADDGQYAEVTCDNGTSFTVGPADTLEAVLAGGLLGLKVCANGAALAGLSLPESRTVTRVQLEGAITAALSALPTPLTMDDLDSPPSGTDSTSVRSVQARNGTFSTFSSTTWSWTASCNAGGGSGAGSASSQSAAANAIQLWVGSANCPSGGGTYSVSQD